MRYLARRRCFIYKIHILGKLVSRPKLNLLGAILCSILMSFVSMPLAWTIWYRTQTTIISSAYHSIKPPTLPTFQRRDIHGDFLASIITEDMMRVVKIGNIHECTDNLYYIGYCLQPEYWFSHWPQPINDFCWYQKTYQRTCRTAMFCYWKKFEFDTLWLAGKHLDRLTIAYV